MPTFTFTNNNGFDVFFYWFTQSGTPTGEGSVTSRERTKTFVLDLPAGTVLRFTTQNGTWDLIPPAPRTYNIKGTTFDTYTILGADRQTHTIRDVSTRFHITNRSASQVFLFTVDPHSGNEVAAFNIAPPPAGNYASDDTTGALKPSTTWRFKDAAGAVLKTYVTTDANYQEIVIAPVALRKNQRSLTAAEKKAIYRCVARTKAERKPNAALNTYDLFVKWHDDAMNAKYAHMGPAFLAWHREYLRRFELELQRISPPEPSTGGEVLGLPYWDWSIDRDSPSWPFTADFLGGNGSGETHKVMDGPFAYDKGKWPLTVFPQYHIGDPADPSDFSPYLRRQIGADPDSSLPSMEDVRTTLAATPFDSAPWNDMSQSGFRNNLEGFRRDMQKKPPEPLPSQMHNRVHRYIGGTMGPATSPYDPIFWLHHCYVDKLWADWQRQHPNEPGYLPDGSAPTGHNLKDIMEPWKDKAPKDVLNILELGYRYD
jgi:tyrosinase